MANSVLNNSVFYNGETISGRLVITVDESDPAIPAIDVLNAGLQFLLKYPDTTDADAVANLTVGSGITVAQNTSTIFEATYVIPGELTRDVLPASGESSVKLEYEVNMTYSDDPLNSDVLEIGTIKIKPRIKKDFS